MSQVLDSIDFSCFDSEVIELINDLDLVLKLSPEGKEWWSRWLASRYRVRFCDRYNQFLAMKQRDNSRLLRDLAKRNAKYSRFHYQNELVYQEDLFNDVHPSY